MIFNFERYFKPMFQTNQQRTQQTPKPNIVILHIFLSVYVSDPSKRLNWSGQIFGGLSNMTTWNLTKKT